VEDPLDAHVPDPVVSRDDRLDPEHQAVLADSVGLGLLVVLDTLPPAERLAFVLHDMFAVPFDEIAPIVDRSATATRQLASRARRRVQGTAPAPEPDRARQREVVDAFFAAAHRGDFQALVAVLDPDVVLRSDRGSLPGSGVVRGADAVAAQALMFADPARVIRPTLVNGAAGVVIMVNGRPVSVMEFTVADGTVVAIDALADPDRLSRLDLSDLDE
jgi:RNA polymerase sigma-70 factor (ECF subfamily)